jgi:hypothetical protein
MLILLLGTSTMRLWTVLPTFRRHMLPLSSGSKWVNVNVLLPDVWPVCILAVTQHRPIVLTSTMKMEEACTSETSVTRPRIVCRGLRAEYFYFFCEFDTRYTARPLWNMKVHCQWCRRDSAVGIATGYGLDDRGVGVGVRVQVAARIFSSPRRPDRLWGQPSLLSKGYRGLFLRM